jgi:hypothetical protein
MTLERRLASMFALDDATWMRHANPWSVWSRNTGLPLLILAFWSRTWIGWWSIVPIVVAVVCGPGIDRSLVVTGGAR